MILLPPPFPLPECSGVNRSDLNCDGVVNLRDFSIFFSRPRSVTVRALSLMFHDWTRPLPAIPFLVQERVFSVAPFLAPSSKTPVGLAQVDDTTPDKPQPSEGLSGSSIFNSVFNVVTFVVRFFVRLFGF